jgi:hypothetical protein
MGTGDEHVTSEESHAKTRVYSINEDGTKLVLLRKGFDKSFFLPDFIGELPDKTIVYECAQNYQGDTAPFIYFENPVAKPFKACWSKGLTTVYRLSGKYLAFLEMEEISEENTRQELWYKDLITGKDRLIFGFIKVSMNSGVSIVGWIQN